MFIMEEYCRLYCIHEHYEEVSYKDIFSSLPKRSKTQVVSKIGCRVVDTFVD